MAQILYNEYELVTIDLESPNATTLLKTCKEALSKDELQKGVGYPFLAVLDADGKVITAQRTDVLEEGDHHDPKLVSAFLEKWKVPAKDAKRVLDEALARASSDDKRVFLAFGAPWCGWCHRLHDWMAQPEIAAILDRDFVIAHIDIDRMTGGKDIQKSLPAADLRRHPLVRDPRRPGEGAGEPPTAPAATSATRLSRRRSPTS